MINVLPIQLHAVAVHSEIAVAWQQRLSTMCDVLRHLHVTRKALSSVTLHTAAFIQAGPHTCQPQAPNMLMQVATCWCAD
jgi:hypothetical protein